MYKEEIACGSTHQHTALHFTAKPRQTSRKTPQNHASANMQIFNVLAMALTIIPGTLAAPVCKNSTDLAPGPEANSTLLEEYTAILEETSTLVEEFSELLADSSPYSEDSNTSIEESTTYPEEENISLDEEDTTTDSDDTTTDSDDASLDEEDR
jgi:hypothetical protein